MWECPVCGHFNPDEVDVCEDCGALRDEPEEDVDDEYLDEEEDLL